MTSPYYVGDDYPLEFAVTEHGKPLYPNSASVTIFDPIGGVVHEGTATIKKNVVRYVVPGEVHGTDGEYTARFPVKFFQVGIKTHVMKYRINALPTSKKVKKPAKDTFETTKGEPETMDLDERWEIAGELVFQNKYIVR